MRLTRALNSAFKKPKYMNSYDTSKTGIARYINYTSEKGRFAFFWTIMAFYTSAYYVNKWTAAPPVAGDPKQTEEFLTLLKNNGVMPKKEE